MTILSQLSSQVGDRSEAANQAVARQCLANPGLFQELVPGLQSPDASLAGDCTEVMCLAAASEPQSVANYAPLLEKLLFHRSTRVRWEAAHTLAYLAVYVPSQVASILPLLSEIIRADKSVIVRDYAIDILGNYASMDEEAAGRAYPLLVEAMAVWNGKHAGHALNGLANVAEKIPTLGPEIAALCEPYLQDQRKGVKQAALRSIKKAEKAN